MSLVCTLFIYFFIYLGFYVAFNTVQVISRRVVGRAEETSTYSSLGLCTVNCRPTARNYQLSHLSPCGDRTPASGGRRECYHSATVALSMYIVNYWMITNNCQISHLKSRDMPVLPLYDCASPSFYWYIDTNVILLGVLSLNIIGDM